MKKDLIQTTKIILLALTLTLGINYVIAWTGPTATPPNENTPTPVNVGTTDQVKDGGLSVESLYSIGTIRSDGGIQVDGNTVIDNEAGWHKSYGDTGWLNATHGGGLFMQDTTWLRAYGNKWFYTGGVMRADDGMRASEYCDIDGDNCIASADMTGGVSTSIADIPMYQCPPAVSLGGGAWGFYGCQGQITNKSTCLIIEYPASQDFPCSYVGEMKLY